MAVKSREVSYTTEDKAEEFFKVMSESPEHQFLKQHLSEVLSRFSSVKLYGYTEADRRRFDVACLLERDWSRPLVGQVLWSHDAGIDKDLRLLLTETDADIRAYVASSTVKHHRAFEEAVLDYRKSGNFRTLGQLKPLWVPSDFDADSEHQRKIIGDLLEEQIVNDILFNVVFGRLNSLDIQLLNSVSGIQGLTLALLFHIATQGSSGIIGFMRFLDVSRGPIVEKLHVLAGAGVVTTPRVQGYYSDTTKGRVFLELIGRIREEGSPPFSPELEYILGKLSLVPVPEGSFEEHRLWGNPYVDLMRAVRVAENRWGIDFTAIDYSARNAYYKNLYNASGNFVESGLDDREVFARRGDGKDRPSSPTAGFEFDDDIPF